MVADVEELDNLDASEINSRRSNAKEVLTPESGEKFVSPFAHTPVELEEEIRYSENPH